MKFFKISKNNNCKIFEFGMRNDKFNDKPMSRNNNFNKYFSIFLG